MRGNNLICASIFGLVWVGLNILRPIFTDPFEITWLIGILLSGTTAAVTGAFAYRWWINR